MSCITLSCSSPLHEGRIYVRKVADLLLPYSGECGGVSFGDACISPVGHGFINMFMEPPVRAWQASPTIFGFFCQFHNVLPNTVWYRGGRVLVSAVMRSPVS